MSFISACNTKSDYNNFTIANCSEKMNNIRYIDGNDTYGIQMLPDLTSEIYNFENQAFIQRIEKDEKIINNRCR